jgi:hypothetical protein
MLTSRLVFLAALAILSNAPANAGAQKSDKSSPSAKQQALSLGMTDSGKQVSAKVGQEIIITVQTIGPGQYETPRMSSSSVRFEGSYFPKEQNPGGPRQVYRFISAAAGEARSKSLIAKDTRCIRSPCRLNQIDLRPANTYVSDYSVYQHLSGKDVG